VNKTSPSRRQTQAGSGRLGLRGRRKRLGRYLWSVEHIIIIARSEEKNNFRSDAEYASPGGCMVKAAALATATDAHAINNTVVFDILVVVEVLETGGGRQG